jgi:DNA polymerase I-like protein with 3'-5' exonuclease and polymerase domains
MELSTPIAIDTEYDPRTGVPWCLSWSCEEGKGRVVMADNRPALAAIGAHVSNPDVLTIFHNAVADLPILESLGIRPAAYHDTMMMAYLLGLPQGLKALAFRLCGMAMVSYGDTVAEARLWKAADWLVEANGREYPNPPEEQVWSPEPQFVWDEVEKWVPCTRRHKDAQPCPLCGGGAGDASGVCPSCINKGYIRREVKRGEKRMVAGTERGHWRVKRPRNISESIGRILGRLGDEGFDPVAAWEAVDEGKRRPVEEALGKMPLATLADIPREAAIRYAARDADATLRVYNALLPMIYEMDLERVMEADVAIIPSALEMMRSGMKIDPGHFRLMGEEYGVKIAELEREVWRMVGRELNLSSPDQLAGLLYGDLGLPIYNRTAEGKASTDDETLVKLEKLHPVVPLLRAHREKAKFKNTYLDVLPRVMDENQRVHTTVKLTRTETGRLATGEPVNLQNQPARGEEALRFRKGFIPEPGNVMVSFDFKNIELVVLAHASRDENMLRAFRENLDLHCMTGAGALRSVGVDISYEEFVEKNAAHDLFISLMRSAAKIINFGIPYGVTAPSLAEQFNSQQGVPEDRYVNETIAQKWIDGWFETYPGAEEYMRGVHEGAMRTGYVRDPIHGRVRFVPEVRSAHKWIMRRGLREAGNMPIQGGAQAVIKEAMRKLWEMGVWEKWGAKLLIQVHDSLECEVGEGVVEGFVEEVKGVMEGAVELLVPVRVDAKWGRNWAECK